jgi:hypothetical protein
MVSLGTEGKGKLGPWGKELIIMASNVHEIPKHMTVFLVSLAPLSRIQVVSG